MELDRIEQLTRLFNLYLKVRIINRSQMTDEDLRNLTELTMGTKSINSKEVLAIKDLTHDLITNKFSEFLF